MNTEKIKYIRDELEITQDEISRMLGCTRSAYSLWEINKNTIPLYYLNKLSNILNINIDYLVDLSDKKYYSTRPFREAINNHQQRDTSLPIIKNNLDEDNANNADNANNVDIIDIITHFFYFFTICIDRISIIINTQPNKNT